MAMTAEHGNKREPVCALGITREPQSGGLSARSRETAVEMKGYGETESGMGTIDTVVDSPIEKSLPEDDNRVSIAMPNITCHGCEAIVGIACAGATSLSMTSCASATVSSGVFSPWAGGAVATFCTYIVANAGGMSCAVGTVAICNATGLCEMLEK